MPSVGSFQKFFPEIKSNNKFSIRSKIAKALVRSDNLIALALRRIFFSAARARAQFFESLALSLALSKE